MDFSRLTYEIYDLLVESLSIRIVGRVFTDEPSLFFFWHRNLLPLPHAFKNTHVKVMISPSRDGKRIGELVKMKGLGVIWSSQHKEPIRGVLSVVRALREGWNVAIVPDGPKGPARYFKRNTFLLTQKLNVRQVFLGVAFSAAYTLPSWDSFRIPMPFSSVSILAKEAYPRTPQEAKTLLDDLDAQAFRYLLP